MRLTLLVCITLSAAACRNGHGAPVDGGTGGGSGGAGGAGGGGAFSCQSCSDAGYCLDDASCVSQCPTGRAACGSSCCAAGSRCCALTGGCIGSDVACPALCPDGLHACPDDELCSGTTCVATCDAAQRCGVNGCCEAGSACVDAGCAWPDLVALAPLAGDAGLMLERRNFDPSWCDVTRHCVRSNGGERALLHFRFRVANQGRVPADLTRAPGASLLAPACLGAPATTLKAFARWELAGFGDAGVIVDGNSDLDCLRDEAPLDGGAPVFTCTAQGLSPGFLATEPTDGVCTAADVTDLDAGTYSLTVMVNPTGLLREERLDNNRVTFPVQLPDTACRGQICSGVCCPPNTRCNAAGTGCALPDLVVDRALLQSSTSFSTETFPLHDCAVNEGCLLDGGTRRLLRFTTSTPNVGEADFYIGDPAQSPNATYDTCHGHYHYHQYAQYRLLSDAGTVVVTGRKQAFCALDLGQYWPDAGPAKYDCTNQGVSVGWADTYDSSLDCQWIDVTDVPPGSYVLEVDVNPSHYIAESDYANNVARVPVFVPDPDGGTCLPQPEICWNGLDDDCDGVPDDGCPPITGNDSCAQAFDVSGGGQFTAAIDAGTAADVSPSCGGAGADVFFRLHLMVPELVYLSTYGSSLDTVLAVYDGLACATERACADDACTLQQSHWSGVLPAGDYVVAVKAKSPGVSGLLQLDVQKSPCTGARAIAGPATLMGDTSNAANDFAAGCGGPGGADQLWYLVSCPSSTTLTASTCGTTWDTTLSVKQGSCRGNEVACDDDSCSPHASQVSVPLSRPGLWFLVVDGYSSTDQGPYTLSVSY